MNGLSEAPESGRSLDTFAALLGAMSEDFRLYYKADQSLLSRLGAAIYVGLEPGFWAIVYYRTSHYLGARGWRFPAVFVMRLNKFLTHADISYQCRIGQRLRLPHCADIVVGSTAVIGDDVEILNGVTLGAREIRSNEDRHPKIGNNVFIGSGAKILGNIRVGDGAKIGANAVVLTSVDPGRSVTGIPAVQHPN
jgi:serine O-acetyltransferase